MWTQYADELIIPPNTAQGLVTPGRRRLLPVAPQEKKTYTIWQTNIGGEVACSMMRVIAQREVERLCVYCQNVVRCTVGFQDIHEFRPIPGLEIGWSQSDLNKVRNTCEVPFLAALPLKQWKEHGMHKKLRFSFSLDRLSSGIKSLRETNFYDLIQRPDICWYINRKHFGSEDLRNQFVMRLDGLKRRLANFRSSMEYDEKLRNLRL